MTGIENGTPPRESARRLLGPGLVLILAVVHLVIVFSIISDSRPLIWSLHNDCVHRAGPGSDFYSVYHAARCVRNGLSPYFYAADDVTPYYYGFRYLPIVAWAGTAFSLLSPEQARVLWIVILEGMLVVTIWTLRKHIRNHRLRLFATCLLIMNSPFFLEQYMGQFTFASVCLLSLAVLASGGLLTFTTAVLLKMFPLLAAPALIRQRQWRLPVLVTIGIVLLTSVPYFIAFPDEWSIFYQSNFRNLDGMDTGNFSLIYFFQLLAYDLGVELGHAHWLAISTALRLTVLGLTMTIVLLSRERSLAVGSAAMLLAHFVTYPQVWEHHSSAIILIVALLFTVPNLPRISIPVLVGCAVLLAVPTPFVLLDQAKDPSVWDPALIWPRCASYLVLLPKLVPIGVLYLSCLYLLWRRDRTWADSKNKPPPHSQSTSDLDQRHMRQR